LIITELLLKGHHCYTFLASKLVHLHVTLQPLCPVSGLYKIWLLLICSKKWSIRFTVSQWWRFTFYSSGLWHYVVWLVSISIPMYILSPSLV